MRKKLKPRKRPEKSVPPALALRASGANRTEDEPALLGTQPGEQAFEIVADLLRRAVMRNRQSHGSQSAEPARPQFLSAASVTYAFGVVR